MAANKYTIDFSYSDDAVLRNSYALVYDNPEDLGRWGGLIDAALHQEGGLNRNSSPEAIAATRDMFDKFLALFPLLFAYWKKYADFEFTIGGTETADMVYERGVASVGASVDMWVTYCTFKIDTSHDLDMIRELFERGAESAGLDFSGQIFWDKYIEFEERYENQANVFAILGRLIHIPSFHHARYCERFRNMTASRPVQDLASKEELEFFRNEIQQEYGTVASSYDHMETELRTRLDYLHLEIANRVKEETNKRWAFESSITRPYFHMDALDEAQLVNWRKYLEFEENEGSYVRTKFLYERCLMTAAGYDEFWLRYARWLLGEVDKERDVRDEEVRIIYRRASCLFVPISRPTIRLQWARFEESIGKSDVARDILHAILENLPEHVETMMSLIDVSRRSSGADSALTSLNELLTNSRGNHGQGGNAFVVGKLITEKARLLWTTTGDAIKVRKVFESSINDALRSRAFWTYWLSFEIQLPFAKERVTAKSARVKHVYDHIRNTAQLGRDLVVALTTQYLEYLQACGGEAAMKEYVEIDQQMLGPFSGALGRQARLDENGDVGAVRRRMAMENGHPGLAVDEAHIRRGGNPYSQYYAEQGEFAATG